MKKKFDIRINPENLAGERIAKYKDFDRLLEKAKAYRNISIMRRRRIFGGLAIAATIALLLAIIQVFERNDSYEAQGKEYFALRDYINPPFDHLKPQFVSHQFNVENGSTIEYPSGTKLKIPLSAFVDENGKELRGGAILYYREMHDFIDIFLSGIPMTYDSAGIEYLLESAGMIELFVEQNGKRANLSPSKSIDIELVSSLKVNPVLFVPTGFNIYKLDEKNRNWVYTDVDRMEVLQNNIEALSGEPGTDTLSPIYVYKEFDTRLKSIKTDFEKRWADFKNKNPEIKEPFKPIRANPSSHVFDLDFSALKHSIPDTSSVKTELTEVYTQYKGMLWQLNPKSSISVDQLENEFSQITGFNILKLNAGEYEMTLIKKDKIIKVIANPVLSDTDYNLAMVEYKRDVAIWEKLSKERETKMRNEQEFLQKQLEQQRRLVEMEFEKKLAGQKKMNWDSTADQKLVTKKIVNRFKATSLGIWNCDRPLPPFPSKIKAEFKDEKGNFYEFKTAFLVDRNRNTVRQFLAKKGATLFFDKSSQNLMWLVTNDNKIALYMPNDFKKIDASATFHSFVLRYIDREISSEEDVRSILKM